MTRSTQSTAGVVLIGGASTRMGVDKATIDVDGQPLALRLAGVLAAAGCQPVWLQGGDRGDTTLATAHVVDDLEPQRGPVAGLLSALQAASAIAPDVDGVLIAACDLIGLDSVAVEAVMAAARPGVVAVAEKDGRWQLLSWWSLSLVDAVAGAYGDGVASYQRLLTRLQVADRKPGGAGARAVVGVDVASSALYNVNTPGDLDNWVRARSAP